MTLLPQPDRVEAVPPPSPVARANLDGSAARRRQADPAGPDVVLVTEGTYPHAYGGVSVWCDQIVSGLPELEFKVVALTAFGYQEPVYQLPAHARVLKTVGLWDNRRDRAVHHRLEIDSLAAFLAQLLTNDHDDVAGFTQFVYELVPYDGREIARQLSFGELLRALDEELREPRWSVLEGVQASDLVQVAEFLDHLLRPLTADPGPAPIYHASSNGLAALVCMMARRRHGGRFVLTEHGIYLRERYLELRRATMSRQAKALLVRFHRLVSATAYAEATVIAPGSRWNQRWETRYGASPARVRTIYNGIDPDEFPVRPTDAPSPVVSWLGRVDPIKDLDTLIRAFAVVNAECPEARLRLYGRTPASGEWYRDEMDALIAELGLDGVVTFEGGVAESHDAYTDAQVAVLSSISEGFPYSVIEAMACGLPTVATGVGGVPEAAADTGFVVTPRDPRALGEAILVLLADGDRRAAMGAGARERVVGHFTLDHCLEDYRALYDELRRGGPARLHVVGQGAYEHSPSQRLLGHDEAEALVAAIGGPDAMTAAVDAEEVAATLESVGITDQVAVERFSSEDVFDLAERAWDQLHHEPAPGELDDRPGLARVPVLGAVGRGLAYVLPAVAVSAATIAGAPQGSLVAASALGWGLAQGAGVLAYTVLHRTPSPTELAPLRKALLGAVLAVMAGGAVAGGLAQPVDALAFSLPLLHLVGSTALVMAARTRVLLAVLAPVSTLSAVALLRPASGLPALVGPVSVVTVAVTLGLVASATRGPTPKGRLVEAGDWLRSLPLVVCGWATAAFALLSVSAVSHLNGFHGVDSRQWLIVGLPLWAMVGGCEWLLLRLKHALKALLESSPSLWVFRRAAGWTVALWLSVAVAALELTVGLATVVADLAGRAALAASSVFLLVAVALLGITVMTAAGRAGRAAVVAGTSAVALGWIAASPTTPFGLADHVAALLVCGTAAGVLSLGAARILVDPASQR